MGFRASDAYATHYPITSRPMVQMNARKHGWYEQNSSDYSPDSLKRPNIRFPNLSSGDEQSKRNWFPENGNQITRHTKSAHLIRAVVALVTDTDEGAGPDVRVTHHTLPIVFLTQSANRNSRLLAAHNQVGMMLSHNEPSFWLV